MSNLPSDLRFTTDHEWVRPQGTAWRIGITGFATEQLGDITIVDLPVPGALLTKGQRFGSVESVKSVSDLYAPVSGKVVAVNSALASAPETVNMDPYGQGWMIEIEPGEPAELDALMSAEAYSGHLL